MSLADTYVLFELDQAVYAVSSSDVIQVDMLGHVTPVPNTAAAVDGVVFSRGQVIPAINLRTRFGLPKQAATARSRLIFLKVRGRIVALIVDSAREFKRIPADTIRPMQETLVGISGNYLSGVSQVGDRSVLIVDVGAVLTLEEIAVPAGAPTQP